MKKEKNRLKKDKRKKKKMKTLFIYKNIMILSQKWFELL